MIQTFKNKLNFIVKRVFADFNISNNHARSRIDYVPPLFKQSQFYHSALEAEILAHTTKIET